MLGLDADEKSKSDEQNSIINNSSSTSLKTKIETLTKTFIASLHNENERNRKDLGLAFYDEKVDLVKNNQNNNFNHKELININSITFNREPTSDNEVKDKKHAIGTIEE